MANTALKIALAILAVATMAPKVFEHYRSIWSLLHNNAPDRMARINNFKSHEIKFTDTIRSCEDALLIESEGLAIFSCDAGRERWNTVMGIFLPGNNSGAELYAYDYKDATAPDSKALKRFELIDYEHGEDFHSLGSAYNEETSTFFIVNHREGQMAVEMFKLDLVSFTAKHLGSIQHPLLHAPNSIAIINDHELYVTNDHYFSIRKHRALATAETYLRLPFGSVVHVDFSSLLDNPKSSGAGTISASVVARLPFANGIAILNSTTVAVASTTSASIYLYNVSRPINTSDTKAPPTFSYASEIELPFLVDNLKLASDGVLYAAGHPNPVALGTFARSRHICNDPAALAAAAAADASTRERCATTYRAGSWVSRWAEGRGVEHLYADVEFPTSCTAAFDAARRTGVVSGLYAKGILVWRE
ncbi:putative paraoxonase [Whalleya microplaca]|nr:putative paraoxonase [Whalleya microplaca]